MNNRLMTNRCKAAMFRDRRRWNGKPDHRHVEYVPYGTWVRVLEVARLPKNRYYAAPPR